MHHEDFQQSVNNRSILVFKKLPTHGKEARKPAATIRRHEVLPEVLNASCQHTVTQEPIRGK